MNLKMLPKIKQSKEQKNLLLNLSADSQTLTIFLYPEEKIQHHYQLTLKNQSLPLNISILLGNVQNIYECLSDPQNFVTDQQKGRVKMKISVFIRGKQIKNECLLQLERVDNKNSCQAHSLQINALRNMIRQLRNQNQESRKYHQNKIINLERNIEESKNKQKIRRQAQQIQEKQRIKDMLLKQSKDFDDKLKLQKDSFMKMVKNIELIHDQETKELKEKISSLGNKTQIQQNKLNNLFEEILFKDKLLDEMERERKMEAQAQDLEKRRRAQLREESRREDERIRIEKEKKQKLMRAREEQIKKMKSNLEANKASMNKLGESKKYNSLDDSEQKIDCKQQ